MLGISLGKRVALGALFAVIVAAGAFFLVPNKAHAQSGVEKSKAANNTTQGRPAQEVTARAGDIIKYTLTYRNQTGSSQTITIEDDLNDVLYLSEITNMGGGIMSGNTIRFENVFVGARAVIERSFEVRVKSMPAGTQDNMMSNSYGNGIDIKVEIPTASKGQTQITTPPKKAPETGTSENVAIILAVLVTGGLFAYQKRFRLSNP